MLFGGTSERRAALAGRAVRPILVQLIFGGVRAGPDITSRGRLLDVRPRAAMSEATKSRSRLFEAAGRVVRAPCALVACDAIALDASLTETVGERWLRFCLPRTTQHLLPLCCGISGLIRSPLRGHVDRAFNLASTSWRRHGFQGLICTDGAAAWATCGSRLKVQRQQFWRFWPAAAQI